METLRDRKVGGPFEVVSAEKSSYNDLSDSFDEEATCENPEHLPMPHRASRSSDKNAVVATKPEYRYISDILLRNDSRSAALSISASENYMTTATSTQGSELNRSWKAELKKLEQDNRFVQVIHQSVRDFLLDSLGCELHDPGSIGTFVEMSNYALLRVCGRFLSSQELVCSWSSHRCGEMFPGVASQMVQDGRA